MSKNLELYLTFKFRIRNLLLSSIIETYLFLQVIYIFFSSKLFLSEQLSNIITYNALYAYLILIYFLAIKLIKFRINNYYIYIVFEELLIFITIFFIAITIKQNTNMLLIIFVFYIIVKIIFIAIYFLLSNFLNFKEEVIFLNFEKKIKTSYMIKPIYLLGIKELDNYFIKKLSKKNINYIIIKNTSSINEINVDKLKTFSILKYDNKKLFLFNKTYNNHLSNYVLIYKRMFDILISLFAILILFPFLIIIAFIIKIDSKGPIFFIQKRHGYRKKIFNIVKFRSMYYLNTDLHSSEQTKINDIRITKFGKFIRKTNIDELPNLINVLIGQMSIVGPRPHALKTKLNNNFFIHRIKNYDHRFLVKPGITSLSHVRNSSGQLTTMSKLKARISFDLIYIKKCSIIYDIKIILMTMKLYI